jgi:predicted enzyme related to lactoylglutathione lyase
LPPRHIVGTVKEGRPIEVTSITAGIPVSNLKTATEWYERLLEKPPDLEPAPGVREFEVGDGCWLQLTEGRPTESQNVFRLGVRDIEAERERLLGIGVDAGEITRIEGVIAFCDFRDPDRNRISLYQVLT